jgi:predicted RecB family nuclease
MPNWTPQQERDFNARMYGHIEKRGHPAPVEEESGLHEQILKECQRRGWLALHGSMAHKTFRTLGEPDFIILADGGKTYFFECKAGDKKPSTEQLGIIAWAAKLGHQVHVVRSFEAFLEAVR